MLHPNNKQRTKMFQCFGVSRFAFNWALGRQQENYKNGGKFISAFDLEKEFGQLKKLPEYAWLNQYSSVIPLMSIMDACNAYKNFFNGNNDFPKFKSKKKSKQSFYVHSGKIEFTDTYVKLMKLSDSTRKNRRKLNWVRLAEAGRVPTNCKYSNPRVTFDGINFWISVSVEVEDSTEVPTNEGIGIDLGIKDLAICSDGNVYRNINKTKEVKRLEKKKKRLQRKLSKKCVVNKYENAKAIQEQSFYSFKAILSYKAKSKNIQIIEVPRFYPSSKTCSVCGTVKSDLKLSDRVFICPECGNKIDRDFNASINLKSYGLSALK